MKATALGFLERSFAKIQLQGSLEENSGDHRVSLVDAESSGLVVEVTSVVGSAVTLTVLIVLFRKLPACWRLRRQP